MKSEKNYKTNGNEFILLTIDKNKTLFQLKNIESDSESPRLFILNIGYDNLANKYFKNEPPTFDEVDYAINEVEEIVVPLHEKINGLIPLYSKDQNLKDIIEIAFNTYFDTNGNKTLSRQELENVFTRLSEIIKGLPASQDILPTNKYFAGYLLILREIIHHLNFSEITQLR